MTDNEDTPDDFPGGNPSLDGYLYQVDVSVWTALDLVLAKKVAQSLVLEPASKEDLETTLSEQEPGKFAANVQVDASTQLVIQCKLRQTGPWKIGGLAALLQHGTDRPSAAKRLEDPRVRYLLVTSADLDGAAVRRLRLTGLGQRPKAKELPPTIAAAVPKDAAGRIGVLAGADPERVQWRIRELLEQAFRIPHSQLESCKRDLRDAALDRMRGVGGGVWTRDELERIIRTHDGYLATSLEAETFVRPSNWNDLKRALTERNAVIITGASGTGKTTAATVLLGELRADLPGITTIHILHGPEEVRADSHAEPVVFVIEDPWGKYRLEPQSVPWNDEIHKLLATANGNRRFIVTSRSDVLAESHTRKISGNWNVTLEADNYGTRERRRLFELRLPSLPRAIQAAAVNYVTETIKRLRTPLEMQRYFDNLAEGPVESENQGEFVERCLASAHRDTIEQTVLQQVSHKEAWDWAAILWGLLKARPKLSRSLLSDIQAGIGDRDRELEDGLDSFVQFMVNGRNLRQVESVISYYHPRVEAGLESAMEAKRGRTCRVLSQLADVLVDLNRDSDDWGLETAASLIRAARALDDRRFRVSTPTQLAVDTWIVKRLSVPGKDFDNELQLAADAGSLSGTAGRLAKWLLTIKRSNWSFGKRWSPDPDTDEWYAEMAADPLTSVVCEGFVRHVLAFRGEHYPNDFADRIDRLAPNLTPTFIEVASSTISRGYEPNVDAIAYGALRNLEGSEAVLVEAIKYEETLQAEDDGALWLAINNGEYDEEYAEHLAESRGQDGYGSDAFIKAYVQETRRQKGWAALRDHPQLEGMTYAWISAVRDEAEKCEEAELLALLDKSFGSTHEARFWDMAEAAWHDAFSSKLLDRMVAGHDSRDVRCAAAVCFVHCGAKLYDQLIGLLLPGNHARLLEIFLDLRSKWRRKKDRKLLNPFVRKALAAVAGGTVAAARALLENSDTTPVLTDDAVGLIWKLNPGSNMELALEKAKLLAAAGEDVSSLVSILVERPRSDGTEDIAYAAGALELAAVKGHWPLVESSLSHRFAAVRKVALEALAARTKGALTPALLALANDKGSGVRRALANILERRPAPEHTDSLIILAADDWSDRRHYYYGEGANLPIAQAAARALQNGSELPESAIEPLIEISSSTKDPDVRSGLIAAVAAKGGAKGIGRICDIAVSRESIRMSVDAAWALYTVRDRVDASTAARLTSEHVTSRNEGVSVCVALAIGACAPPNQVMETAKVLSSSSKRRALLVPLVVGAAENATPLAEETAKLLPPDRETALLAAFSGGPKLARGALNDLGDIRIVQEVIRRLSPLFAPETK